MNSITDRCTGCRTCEKVCPKQSISMITDIEGFLIPSIDQNTCIDCKLCQKRCPQNGLEVWKEPIAIYAVRDKNDKEIYRSASGGAFAVLANFAIEQHNAVVFGAAYIDENLHVGHLYIDDVNDLYKLQSSKYVQSNTLDTYAVVKKNLNDGRKVVYSGTPCQIAGLKSYINKDDENLLTIDLICHGVPSPLLFEKYLEWLSIKTSKIISYNFRDKSRGWGLKYKVKTKTKTKVLSGVLDPYYYHFLEGNTYRESCYYCRYCRKERVGDITIGDYWGIEKEHPNFFSTKGVSCVLVNTSKGMEAFSAVQEKLHCIESSFDQVALHNGNLLRSTKRNEIRNHIYDGIRNKPINQFFCENMVYPRSLKARIKSMIPSKIEMFLKKLK